MGLVRSLAKRVLGMNKADAGESSGAGSQSPAPPVQRLQAPGEAEELTKIDSGAQEIIERVECGEPVDLVDVRSADEVKAGTLPGAILIPFDELEARWEEVRQCNEIICFSENGDRSLKAAKFLRGKGLFTSTSLEGGLKAWREYGGSLVTPEG